MDQSKVTWSKDFKYIASSISLLVVRSFAARSYRSLSIAVPSFLESKMHMIGGMCIMLSIVPILVILLDIFFSRDCFSDILKKCVLVSLVACCLEGVVLASLGFVAGAILALFCIVDLLLLYEYIKISRSQLATICVATGLASYLCSERRVGLFDWFSGLFSSESSDNKTDISQSVSAVSSSVISSGVLPVAAVVGATVLASSPSLFSSVRNAMISVHKMVIAESNSDAFVCVSDDEE